MDMRVLANPFPGLRPFTQEEADLFFGRDRQSDALVRRLATRRFVPVVGTSGSGKSSLVRAGLLPSLEAGFMSSAGAHWRTAILRPQDDPFGFLARALVETGALADRGLDPLAAEAIIETTLRRSSLGLVESIRLAKSEPHENLLIVVDQFEELFRFADLASQRGAENEAPAFVRLLLEAARQTAVPIYVVITMRSDFLGDCARFRDLPETISDSQYLVPRLTRDELAAAITGPVGVRGGRIGPSLVQRLLNEVGDDMDQLPLLQHALMRAWDHWQSHGSRERGIDESDLEAVGGLADALSRHADEAYDSLATDRDRELAQRLFKCLTEKGPDNREIRRPTPLARIAEIANASVDEVARVVDVFRAPGRSFLMPPHEVALANDTVVDISHESLIRQWKRLRVWVEVEAESHAVYLRLVDAAKLFRAGKGGLSREPDLSYARQWLEREKPNSAWAAQYGPGFDEVLAFLAESETSRAAELEKERARAEAEHAAKERELEQAKALAETQKQRADEQAAARARQRGFSWALLAFLVLAVGAALYGWQQGVAAKYQGQVALARQLAAQSELVRAEPGRIRESLELAIRATEVLAAQRARSFDVDAALRRGLALTPRQARPPVRTHADLVFLAPSADNEIATLSEVVSGDKTAVILERVAGGTGKVVGESRQWPGKLVWAMTGEDFVVIESTDERRILDLRSGQVAAVIPRDEQLLAIDSKGELFATGTADGVRIRVVASGLQRGLLANPPGPETRSGPSPVRARMAAFPGRSFGSSLDAELVVGYRYREKSEADRGADGGIAIWPFGYSTEISNSWSVDGLSLLRYGPQRLYWGNDDEIHAGAKAEGLTFAGPGDGGSFAIAPWDGSFVKNDLIATASASGLVRLWRVGDRIVERRRFFLNSQVRSLRFVADGSELAVGDASGLVTFWRASESALPQEKHQIPKGAPIKSNILAASRDAHLVMTQSYLPNAPVTAAQSKYVTTIQLFKDEKPLGPAIHAEGTIQLGHFSQDGRYMVTRLNQSPEAKLVVWDVPTGKQRAELKIAGSNVEQLHMAADGRLVVFRLLDKSLWIWSWQTQATARRFAEGVGFAVDEPRQRIAFATQDGVHIWDLDKLTELAPRLEVEGVRELAFSPDGEFLATQASGEPVWVWQLDKAERVGLVEELSGEGTLEFIRGGSFLAKTSGADERRTPWALPALIAEGCARLMALRGAMTTDAGRPRRTDEASCQGIKQDRPAEISAGVSR